MKKNTLLTLLLILLMLTLLLFPNLCLQSAQKGLLLWFNKVLPSLLPFIILINILVPLDGLRKVTAFSTPFTKKIWHLPGHSFFALVMGLSAGYPMGAKVIKTLYLEHKLTKEEAEITLCFSNNCGPLFIIGTIGTAMLSCTELGYFLFFIHLLSALLMSLLVTQSNTSHCILSSAPTTSSDASPTFSSLLNHGVMNAMDTIVCVGGYIILFSVLTTLLTETPLATAYMNWFFQTEIAQTTFSGLIAGLLEISNGSNIFSTLPFSIYSLAAISSTIGFGGLCVYFQTLYVLEGSDLSTKHYLVSKGLQGLLSFGFTLLFYPIYVLYTQGTPSIFSFQSFIIGFSTLTLVMLLSCLIFKKPLYKPQLHSNK